MKRSMIIFFAEVLTLVSLLGRSSVSLAHTGDDHCLDEEAAAFLVLIYDYREQNNLAPLVAPHDLGGDADEATEEWDNEPKNNGGMGYGNGQGLHFA